MTPHTYHEDTRRKALRRAFLGEGSVPPTLNEDGPAVMAVAPPMVDKHNTSMMLNPCEAGDTSARWG
jgi:hypothetical protein